MERLLKRLVLFCVALGWCAHGHSATINVACDFLAISNAIMVTAVEGDTIQIGAGDCTITNYIFCTRGISFTIAGSGTNQTTLRGSAGQLFALWITSTSTNVFTLRDFNFVGASGTGYGMILGAVGTTQNGFFHAYNIKMTNVFGRGLSVGGGSSRFGGCLVDHCTFIGNPSGFVENVDLNGCDYGSWTNASPLGTTNVSCFEDCYFGTAPSGVEGNGHFDSYRGARALFRHNVFDGYAPIGGHGYDSQITSIHTWEIYNNLFTNWNGPTLSVWRGGTGVIFSNTVVGSYGSMLVSALGYYRQDPTGIGHASDQLPTGYMPEGVPGSNYVVNFTSYNQPPGRGFPQAAYSDNGMFAGYNPFPTGNATNLQYISLNLTRYTFVTNLADATFGMNDVAGYGGGAVLIGATAAQTITNLMNAINLGPGYGVTRTNWSDPTGTGYRLGYDFVAPSCDTTNLYCRNALDSTNGYPANQQQGVIRSWPLTSSNFYNPQTVWTAWFGSNIYNGALVNVAEPAYTTGALPQAKLGRDITNGIPSSAVYTPLVYPHPLNMTSTGGTGGIAITGAVINVSGTARVGTIIVP